MHPTQLGDLAAIEHRVARVAADEQRRARDARRAVRSARRRARRQASEPPSDRRASAPRDTRPVR